jgi:hypothetical protein
VKTITLTKGYVATVDDEDFDFLMRWKWSATVRENGKVYAVRGERGRGAVYMHREINRTPAGLKTDHRDGDGLNNRRGNLRDATNAQNAANAGAHRDAVSRFKGVSPNCKSGKPWIASICVLGRHRYLGVFDTEEEAGAAYARAAAEAFGEFNPTSERAA